MFWSERSPRAVFLDNGLHLHNPVLLARELREEVHAHVGPSDTGHLTAQPGVGFRSPCDHDIGEIEIAQPAPNGRQDMRWQARRPLRGDASAVTSHHVCSSDEAAVSFSCLYAFIATNDFY